MNVPKYLLLLETLKFQTDEPATVANENARLAANLKTLQQIIKHDLQEIIKKNASKLQLPQLAAEMEVAEHDVETGYVLLMQELLLEVVDNTNFDSDAKEDLISTRHMNLCIEAVQDLAACALSRQLHPVFCQKGGVFAGVACSARKPDYALLQLSVTFFDKILQIKQFHVANSMEEVLRYYMAAIYTLFLGQQSGEWSADELTLQQLQAKLEHIWQHISKMAYFRNILMLKGLPQLPAELKRRLHCDLMEKLAAADGFTTLVATLHTAQRGQSTSDKPICEAIAKIVAFRGHTRRFKRCMIEQVYKYLQLCLRNEPAMADSMGVGLLCLRRLYDLNEETRLLVQQHLHKSLEKLFQPDELLSGLILMEHDEFCLLISLCYQLFCTSIVECLPSELLIVYLPLLLHLYYNVPPNFVQQKKQIGSLIMRCLNNRTEAELQDIIEKLYTCDLPVEWHELHARLLLLPNAELTKLRLQVASADCQQECCTALAVPELLMSEEYHLLTYRIFMILLRLIWKLLEQHEAHGASSGIELLQTEQELHAFLQCEYSVKVEILLTLNTLVSKPALKSQITENAKDFLQFLRSAIEQRVQDAAVGHTPQAETRDHVLLLLLTLSEELLAHTGAQLCDDFCDFVPTLRRLRVLTPNQLVRQRVDALLTLLSGDVKTNDAASASAFQQARALIEAPETHLQVYGIQMLLELLRRRDVATLANGHMITALALNTLKSKESYTFLNCVRLFVGLVDVMEAEVLELLCDEYLNDNASVDYRLVLGEAILKVGQQLGPLCYKYKAVLLNCFMRGARSPQNEFRMSAFANLAQLCRTLCYQVHSCFQELLNLIDSELTTGSYLPSQRAAVLVLSDLLEGMDNLLDFEQMLLPIYRRLKLIAAADSGDAQLRLHAANGLQVLAEKCKQLLCQAQPPLLQKEIQIFGIKNKPKDKLKSHILELN